VKELQPMIWPYSGITNDQCSRLFITDHELSCILLSQCLAPEEKKKLTTIWRTAIPKALLYIAADPDKIAAVMGDGFEELASRYQLPVTQLRDLGETYKNYMDRFFMVVSEDSSPRNDHLYIKIFEDAAPVQTDMRSAS
jgi:hypothetical protein